MNRLDRILVVSTSQRDLLIEAGIDPKKVEFIPDYVDTAFFNPALCDGQKEDLVPLVPDRYILSVGQERRDYTLLLGALAASDIPAVVVPSSAWVASGGLPNPVPPNVTVLTGLSFDQLRNLYHQASCVVVPILPGTQYAAGVNALLEGLAMARPVIVSRTSGLRDYLDSAYMTVISSGDHDALVTALREHWSGPAGASNPEGRLAALEKYSLERYVNVMTEEVNRVSGLGARKGSSR